MNHRDLPQICVKCRKLKMPNLGTTVPGYRYNTFRFTCFECSSKPKVTRLCRTNNETQPESEVRQWLAKNGYTNAVAEYKLRPFIYDFAVPSLGLLIELDSKSYHQHPRHKIQDAKKDLHATSQGWTVKRVTIGPHMLLDLERCLIDAKAYLVK